MDVYSVVVVFNAIVHRCIHILFTIAADIVMNRWIHVNIYSKAKFRRICASWNIMYICALHIQNSNNEPLFQVRKRGYLLIYIYMEYITWFGFQILYNTQIHRLSRHTSFYCKIAKSHIITIAHLNTTIENTIHMTNDYHILRFVMNGQFIVMYILCLQEEVEFIEIVDLGWS